MTHWHARHANILDQTADGLVCSANPQLNLSGGVGGEFALRYGPEMQNILREQLLSTGKPYFNPGSVVRTPGFGSGFDVIIHAVAIDGFYDTTEELILQTYLKALTALADAGCRTVVATCLACGYGRFPPTAFVSLLPKLMQLTPSEVTEVLLCTTNADLARGISAGLSTTDG